MNRKQEKWHEIVKRVEDVGVDGLELNFGCPHGMAERGMGAASGQVPELVEKQTYWVKEAASNTCHRQNYTKYYGYYGYG